jgi:hypothetical protein
VASKSLAKTFVVRVVLQVWRKRVDEQDRVGDVVAPCLLRGGRHAEEQRGADRQPIHRLKAAALPPAVADGGDRPGCQPAPPVTERPGPLAQLDRYFAAATIAHEYVSELHRELAALGEDNRETQKLLRESASISLSRMPEVTQNMRRLEREWGAQQLLDPAETRRILGAIEECFVRVEGELSRLRARQDEIAAALLDRLERARPR